MSSYKVPFEGTEDYQNILAKFLAHLNAIDASHTTLYSVVTRLAYEGRKDKPGIYILYTSMIHAGRIWQYGEAAHQFLEDIRAYRSAYEAEQS